MAWHEMNRFQVKKIIESDFSPEGIQWKENSLEKNKENEYRIE